MIEWSSSCKFFSRMFWEKFQFSKTSFSNEQRCLSLSSLFGGQIDFVNPLSTLSLSLSLAIVTRSSSTLFLSIHPSSSFDSLLYTLSSFILSFFFCLHPYISFSMLALSLFVCSFSWSNIFRSFFYFFPLIVFHNFMEKNSLLQIRILFATVKCYELLRMEQMECPKNIFTMARVRVFKMGQS